MTDVSAVDAGHVHSCAITGSGTVVCWGADGDGQATPPAGLNGVAQLSAGGFHTCATKNDGTVVCWGLNGSGQSTPPADLASVTQVSAGGSHTCALKSDGTAVCWGHNFSGQATPPAELSGAISVGAGGAHSCAVNGDGTVACWGDDLFGRATPPAGLNLFGATGGETTLSVSAGLFFSCAVTKGAAVTCWGSDSEGQATPPAALGAATQVAAGYHHACAIESEGTVACWGHNGFNQATPPAGLSSVVQISASQYHTCAVKGDGTLACWGTGGNGQLLIPAGLSGVTQVSTSYVTTCVRKSDGTVQCWGDNLYGQSNPPTGLTDVVEVGAGGLYTCALKSDGTVVCWGSNEGNQATPPPGLSGVTQLSVNQVRSCARKSDGTVVCWGNSQFADLTPPAGLSGVVQVSTGVHHVCAVKSDDTVVCWGSNENGEATPPPELSGSSGNQPPVADAGESYHAAEGTAITFDGSGSSDPENGTLAYDWDFGDGTTHGTGVGPTHTYADDATTPYTVTLSVTDAGDLTASATTTATIANADPALTMPANAAIQTGQAFGLSATFSDAGVQDAPWTYTVDWGDGSSAVAGMTSDQSAPITGSHAYPIAGTYTITLAVTDKDQGSGSGTVQVTVAGPPKHPPVANPGGPYSGTEGSLVQFSAAQSTDPDGDRLTYQWSFGDGGTATGAAPAYRYTDNGAYAVTLTVTDATGLAHTASTTANISNVAPLAALKNNGPREGGPFTLTFVNMKDASIVDVQAGFQYAFDCGSGAGYGAFTASATGSCPPAADDGTVAVRGKIRDKDNGVTEYAVSVMVKNVAPIVTLAADGPTTVQRGATFSVTGSFGDPGVNDGPWLYTIAWGDGTPTTVGTTGPTTPISASHVYTSAGKRTVTMTITEKNGAGAQGVSNRITVTVK